MEPTANLVAALWDREMIRDCLYRYCRGIDRTDEAALRSAYWPDGTDDHGAYRDNVTLKDCLEHPILEITETGIRTAEGEVEVDIIIAAIGYDALTGAMLSIDIQGRDGRSLKDKWAEGGRSHLGLMMEGFPNLFIIAGPNGPSALANFILLNEQNVDWACDCIAHLRANGLQTIEADGDAEDGWMRKVTELGSRSLYPTANTWYTGANVPGKPRTFPVYIGGLGRYREICADAAAEGYRGFTLR